MIPQGDWFMSKRRAVLRQGGEERERLGLDAVPVAARRGRSTRCSRWASAARSAINEASKNKDAAADVPELVLRRPGRRAAADGRRAGDVQHPDRLRRHRHPEADRPARPSRVLTSLNKAVVNRRLRLRHLDLVAAEDRRVRLRGPGAGAHRQAQAGRLLHSSSTRCSPRRRPTAPIPQRCRAQGPGNATAVAGPPTRRRSPPCAAPVGG